MYYLRGSWEGPHVPNIVLSCHSSGVFHVVAILAQLRDLDGLLGIYRTLLLFSFRHTCGKPGRTDYAWITSRPPDIPFLAVFFAFFCPQAILLIKWWHGQCSLAYKAVRRDQRSAVRLTTAYHPWSLLLNTSTPSVFWLR